MLYRVDIDRNATDTIYVEADSEEAALADARELAPDLDFDDVTWGYSALPAKVDKLYPSTEYWTGGPDGEWDLLPPQGILRSV